MTPKPNISELLSIMAKLRNSDGGCPWDIAQTFATIAPYTIEEAYEVADAIARSDLNDLKEELGDLLLQVVFHSQMASEQSAFDFGDVVEGICAKLLRRHPHVFGERAGRISADEVKGLWSRIKAEEKVERAQLRGETLSEHGILSLVKSGQPALAQALDLQRAAATVGFDWNDPRAVLDKLREEADEIEAALNERDPEALAEEIGDLLFVAVNLARHAKADPEMALRQANAKFTRRFGHIEATLKSRGRALTDASLDEMEALWIEAKHIEKNLEKQKSGR